MIFVDAVTGVVDLEQKRVNAVLGWFFAAREDAADDDDEEREGESADDAPKDFGVDEIGEPTAFLYWFSTFGDLVEIFFAIHML